MLVGSGQNDEGDGLDAGAHMRGGLWGYILGCWVSESLLSPYSYAMPEQMELEHRASRSEWPHLTCRAARLAWVWWAGNVPIPIQDASIDRLDDDTAVPWRIGGASRRRVSAPIDIQSMPCRDLVGQY